MDIAFEILLPVESIIPSIKFEVPEFEWQGEKYPQGPEEAYVHQFKLVKSPVTQYIIPLLPESLKSEGWQCIAVMEGVDELAQRLINEGQEIKKKDADLFALLTTLTQHEERWVIVFEPDCDQIDFVIEGGLQLVYNNIIESLTIEKRGFVIWFNGFSREVLP
ncbi:hypothetical protein SAMN04488128_102393 [Chitinophaga eiseniae]|uniref:Uncharacterized protein n=1 Tax=Chitinophaga eiseniae TaxID=634771 RepID=A0A1T4QJU6_9BACT|nr:hypothetical protein [Chitinophaga eiseniae]SKA03538.1 hypothetical protein SAMN04488128_102393 [Chitinophaga eiseniae]